MSNKYSLYASILTYIIFQVPYWMIMGFGIFHLLWLPFSVVVSWLVGEGVESIRVSKQRGTA